MGSVATTTVAIFMETGSVVVPPDPDACELFWIYSRRITPMGIISRCMLSKYSTEADHWFQKPTIKYSVTVAITGRASGI